MTINDEEPTVQSGSAPFLPCTPTQQRWWFLSQLQPDDPSPNIAALWEIEGGFHPAILEKAFRIIVERHEILRTRFIDIKGEPFQEPLDHATFNISSINLTILSPAARTERIEAICEREAMVPFNLSEPPLLRATLITLEERRALILIVAHHIVFDGWSIGILGRELGTIAAELQGHRPSPLAPLPLQYGDYALWQKEYLEKGGADADARYWQQQLANLSYFEVAPDRPRRANRSSTSGIVFKLLDARLGEGLEAAARDHAVSFFSFGCAIIAAMLHHETHQSDVVIGTQVAGRDEVDLEPLIGAFTNNIVLRFKVEKEQSFSSLVQDAAKTTGEAITRQRLPFDHVVRLLNCKRDLSRTPLYSINVVMQRAFMEDRQYGDFTLKSAPSPSAGALYDLNFQMVRRPSGWRLALEFNADLFTASTAKRLLSRWVEVMEIALTHPSARLAEFQPSSERPSARSAAERGKTSDPAALASPESRAGDLDANSDQIERKLIDIWREVLRVKDVTSESNFFDLGGHSLPAMRMITQASAQFGVKLDPFAFFAAPTIAEFARHIAGLRAAEPWRIVAIQPQGDLPPIIALNGTMLFYNLAAKVGLDRPFISVQAFDPHTAGKFDVRPLEEIAASYVSLVRAAYPPGPYILVGHCALGAYALETAQQLQASGAEVRALVLFDSWAPGHSRDKPWLERIASTMQYRFHDHARRFARVFSRETTILEYLASFQMARSLLVFLWRIGLVNVVPQRDTGMAWFIDYLIRARRNYCPKTYNGDVILFQSDDSPTGSLFDPYFGWKSLVKGRLQVHRVGGSHLTICAAQRAGIVAERIAAFLADDYSP